MKTIKQSFLAITISLIVLSCKNNENAAINKSTLIQTENTKAIVTNSKTASFEIEGMTCAIGCASLIEDKLNKLTGVTEAKVDFETKTATVIYDADKLDQEILTETVEGIAGGDLYKVSKVKS